MNHHCENCVQTLNSIIPWHECRECSDSLDGLTLFVCGVIGGLSGGIAVALIVEHYWGFSAVLYGLLPVPLIGVGSVIWWGTR